MLELFLIIALLAVLSMAVVITAPNPEYNGISAGVRFIDGKAVTADPRAIEWLGENGYGVGEAAPEPPQEPQLDAADTQINPKVPATGVDPRIPEMATPHTKRKPNPNVPTVDGSPVFPVIDGGAAG